MSRLRNWIDNKFDETSRNKTEIDHLIVTNPSNNSLIGYVPISDENDCKNAIESCKKAFELWRLLILLKRSNC